MAEWVGRVAPSRADWISFRIVKKAAIGARRCDAPCQRYFEPHLEPRSGSDEARVQHAALHEQNRCHTRGKPTTLGDSDLEEALWFEGIELARNRERPKLVELVF